MSRNFNPQSHIGEVHGIFTLTDVLDEKDKYGHYIYQGTCNKCGYVKYSHYGAFSGNKSVITICNHVDITGRYITPTKWTNSRIGNIFRGMKSRCYNKNDDDYKHYGAKEIKIYDEWLNNPLNFEAWSLKNGYSDNLTIDRIDGDKDYCPENCRWISLEENSVNKHTTNFITVDGVTHTGREWSQKLGFGLQTINKYVKKYGIDNVEEFIRKRLSNPELEPKHKQSYYDLYMTIQN